MGRCSGRQSLNLERMIDGDGHGGVMGEGTQAANLGWGHDLIGDENVPATVGGEHLGLTQSGDADATNRAGSGQLSVRDGRTPVDRHMRPQFCLALLEEGMHGVDIVL